MSTHAQIVNFPKQHSTCAHCLAVKSCPFGAVTGAGAEAATHPTGAARVVRTGEHLFRVGDAADGVHVVRSGAVKTYITTRDGEEQVIGLHGPGELLGADAIPTGKQICNAVALDVSTVCAVTMDRILHCCADSPAFCSSLLTSMSGRIQHDEDQLIVLGLNGADQRVACFLLEQIVACRRRGQSTREILLPMSRSDIASYLAVAVETVSRSLTRLREAGVLSVDRNLIVIQDAEALRAVAGARARGSLAAAAGPRAPRSLSIAVDAPDSSIRQTRAMTHPDRQSHAG
ncbi:MAG: Crp/Fnr family transcriptional regulator [Gammaproteobacteria bacterium]